MIQVIDGKRYDTDKAQHIFTHWNGYNRTDFKFRSKRLFLTAKGSWFIHHQGGALTDMAVNNGSQGRGGSESIEPVTPDDAFGFLEAHSDEKEAIEAIEKHFADRVEEA
jgi:hypothetical protein